MGGLKGVKQAFLSWRCLPFAVFRSLLAHVLTYTRTDTRTHHKHPQKCEHAMKMIERSAVGDDDSQVVYDVFQAVEEKAGAQRPIEEKNASEAKSGTVEHDGRAITEDSDNLIVPDKDIPLEIRIEGHISSDGVMVLDYDNDDDLDDSSSVDDELDEDYDSNHEGCHANDYPDEETEETDDSEDDGGYYRRYAGPGRALGGEGSADCDGFIGNWDRQDNKIQSDLSDIEDDFGHGSYDYHGQGEGNLDDFGEYAFDLQQADSD